MGRAVAERRNEEWKRKDRCKFKDNHLGAGARLYGRWPQLSAAIVGPYEGNPEAVS